MSITSKNVFVVSCELAVFEEHFSRKRSSDIINYYEIRQRLTNNDVMKNPPSQDVIEFQIIKKLNLFSKCKKTEFLFFYADKLNISFINGLKSLLKESPFEIKYHLLISPERPLPRIQKEFDTVQRLE